MNQEIKFKTPILILAWKRPKKTEELINKIKQINPDNLYIACDGPKNENDLEDNKVNKTKELLSRSFKEVRQKKYLYRDKNQGCKIGVSNAINWFFEHEKEGIMEAEYQGKKVKLNDPIRGGSKKFYVYVKDGDKVKKVSFGDTTGLSIKRDDPARRKSFRARHNCDNPGPKTKARYWSCYQWRAGAKVDN